jgi:hypothetical protein
MLRSPVLIGRLSDQQCWQRAPWPRLDRRQTGRIWPPVMGQDVGAFGCGGYASGEVGQVSQVLYRTLPMLSAARADPSERLEDAEQNRDEQKCDCDQRSGDEQCLPT